ncbi:hypothetical protein HPP92_019491 [Vanilla planifolia]|uniref:Uncharacterized protein n=1 Tax=Vanilla planifolia TaxID=51239 RepID=A0A835QCK2_VANPL|nr:hypothetical protein HPP92_019491 [Vanilla planifolia]
MPTFTAVALDRLLEPGSRNPAIPKPPPSPFRLGSFPLPTESNSRRKSTPQLPLTSPALYATPESTPLPDSPFSFPSSPYIINHKRRGPRLQNSLSKPPPPPTETERSNEVNSDSNVIVDGKTRKEEVMVAELNGNKEKKEVNGLFGAENATNNGSEKVVAAQNESKLNFCENETDREAEDFFDLLDSMSSTSVQEGDGSYGIDQLRKLGTPLGEFYDAYDEISSDDGSKSSFGKVEVDIREMRLNLLMEIERRKQVEDALENIQKRWLNLCQHLSAVGLVLPYLSNIMEEEANQSNLDPVEDLCQQIIIAKTVAASVAGGRAKAETELKMQTQIEMKNFENARLWDRLHYYEAANREMSQRNQEAIETARQLRYRRKRRQKWFWGSIGLVLTLGSAAIAWSYLPSSKAVPSSMDGASTDGQGH